MITHTHDHRVAILRDLDTRCNDVRAGLAALARRHAADEINTANKNRVRRRHARIRRRITAAKRNRLPHIQRRNVGYQRQHAVHQI